MKNVNIENSWFDFLKEEFKKPYFLAIQTFLEDEYKRKNIFPDPSLIFNAFNLCPLKSVKIVIIGQDPYHGKNQAHGLCFSVPGNLDIPPSLRNIYKELSNDTGEAPRLHGDLSSWARQGVFLLNTILTVEEGKAHSHKEIGWEKFTDNVIQKISNYKTQTIFILWGAHAQKKEKIIDTSKHSILKAVHPSPLSAYNGFFGCKHFSKANQLLVEYGETEIAWKNNKILL